MGDYDAKSGSRLLLTTVLLTLFLIGSFGIRAHAFTNGQSASLVIGQKDFTSRGYSTSQTGFHLPGTAIFDSSGNMWVADVANNRILEFKPPFATGMQASFVIGQKDFTTKSQATTQSGLAFPFALAFDSSGNLWVAETLNNRVLEFKPPFSNGMNASLVIGQPDFATYASATTQNGFSEPHSPRFDSSGNLWVSEGPSTSRVLEFTSSTSSSVTTTSPTTTAQSTPSTTTLVQSSQTSVTSTTTNQAFGQLIQIAAGVAIVVVAVGLIAVFLLRSRRKSEATRTTQTPLSGSIS